MHLYRPCSLESESILTQIIWEKSFKVIFISERTSVMALQKWFINFWLNLGNINHKHFCDKHRTNDITLVIFTYYSVYSKCSKYFRIFMYIPYNQKYVSLSNPSHSYLINNHKTLIYFGKV